ncbi:MAG: hypothetical protein ACRDZO_09535 [Egibacteraceae bacterium]
MERGARPAREPEIREGSPGKIIVAAIEAYGDTVHSLVDASHWTGVFLSGFRPLPDQVVTPVRLETIDHVVANVEQGRMDDWVAFYASVMGFTQLVHYDDKTISIEYSALMSKVGVGRRNPPKAGASPRSRSTSTRTAPPASNIWGSIAELVGRH